MILDTGLKMTQKQATKTAKDFFQVLGLPFLDQREIFLETEKWNDKPEILFILKSLLLSFSYNYPRQ